MAAQSTFFPSGLEVIPYDDHQVSVEPGAERWYADERCMSDGELDEYRYPKEPVPPNVIVMLPSGMLLSIVGVTGTKPPTLTMPLLNC